MKANYDRTVPARRRGQPLALLSVVLIGWIALRIVTWEAPFAEPQRAETRVPISVEGADRPTSDPKPGALPKKLSFAERETGYDSVRPEPSQLAKATPVILTQYVDPPFAALKEATPASDRSPSYALGQESMALDGRHRIPVSDSAIGVFGRDPRGLGQASRWSGDAWLLARQDTTTPITSGRGSYGRSQAGAVLRYRLLPSSPHRPAAYGRVTRALVGPPSSEVALGLSARPMPQVPVAVAVEGRALLDGPAGGEVRPAAFAYTELPPQRLPLGFRGEAYAQAGYVGGTFATAFVEAQARVERAIRDEPRGDLRAGAGIWGGAQRGAARLDMGPTATVTLDFGEARGQASIDYRFRVAGQAEPSSGMAVTLSAGF